MKTFELSLRIINLYIFVYYIIMIRKIPNDFRHYVGFIEPALTVTVRGGRAEKA